MGGGGLGANQTLTRYRGNALFRGPRADQALTRHRGNALLGVQGLTRP